MNMNTHTATKLPLDQFIERVRAAKTEFEINLLATRLRDYGDAGMRAIAGLLSDTNSEVIVHACAVLGTAHAADNRLIRPALAKLLSHPNAKIQTMVLPSLIAQALNGYDEAVNALHAYVVIGSDQKNNYLVALHHGDFSAHDRKSKYLPKL